ncbi:protein-tyrosine phosphatase-like protein [Coniochaeta sp. 2T2.1]|nr:protein-tyrosine phosphatase-like protein [Coniochaeta sp. 2T2.1]
MPTLPPPPETASTLPSPPFVAVRGIPNLRDLGGWPISSSTRTRPLSIRRHYIYRCGEPTSAPPSTIGLLTSPPHRIATLFDLRSKAEIEGMQISGEQGRVVDWPGVKRVEIPVFDERADPAALAIKHAGDMGRGLMKGEENGKRKEDPFSVVYKDILESGAAAYETILRHVLEHPPHQEPSKVGEEGEAFLIHCTAGKDRTGVFCALVLSLCGVADEIVADEYALSERGLGAWMEHLVGVVVARTGVTEEQAWKMAGARRESILDALRFVKEEWGGVEEYFEKMCRVSREDLEKIKGLLVVEEEPVCGLNR